jgi:SAM-dependent methyltransferase
MWILLYLILPAYLKISETFYIITVKQVKSIAQRLNNIRIHADKDSEISKDFNLRGNFLHEGRRYIYSMKNYEKERNVVDLKLISGLFLNLGIQFIVATNANANERTVRPSKKDIEDVFKVIEWDNEYSVTKPSNFRRLDESPDSIFYSRPRFVEHIDDNAVKALINFHKVQLKELSQKLYGQDAKSSDLDILDLCSSWVSHLPLDDFPVINADIPSRLNIGESLCYSKVAHGGSCRRHIVGIGMNEEELKRNRQLTSYAIKDLNQNPKLPFDDNVFDAILLQLSIDYLTKPEQLMTEIGRVLRPKGGVYIT